MLSDVARLESGHTPSRRSADYWEGGDVPWLSLKDIRRLSGRYVTHTQDMPTQLGIDNSSARVLPQGTVAFCRTASVGKVAILGRDMATSQDFANWVCGPSVVPEYLYEALRASTALFGKEKQGSTHQTIYMPVLEKFQLLVPPLAEQRRIADILEQADAMRQKRRAAIAQLDTLTQAIFLDMFGDPATNPMGWPCHSLGSIALKMSDGPFGSNLKSAHYTDSGIRVIRLQNIGVGNFSDRDHAFVSKQHFASLKKHECRPGDVLIGTMGEPNLRACLQPAWLDLALNKADCVQLRTNPELVNEHYICALLNLPATEAMAQDLIHGQTRLRISMGRLRGMKVPVPGIHLQREFAARVASVSVLVERQSTSLVQLDALFASLQHRAFRGEL